MRNNLNTTRILILLALLAILILLPKQAKGIAIADAPTIEIVEKPDIKTYAEQETLKAFGEGQWVYMDRIFKKESGWTILGEHYPISKLSTAYGLGGFLDGTWKTVGCVKTNDPYIQIDCTIKYVKKNYKTPAAAIQFHNIHNYY